MGFWSVAFMLIVGIVLFCICTSFSEDNPILCILVMSVILAIMLFVYPNSSPDTKTMLDCGMIALLTAILLMSIAVLFAEGTVTSYIWIVLCFITVFNKLYIHFIILLPFTVLITILNIYYIRRENITRKVLAKFDNESENEWESYTPGYTEITLTPNTYGSGYSGNVTRVSARGKSHRYYKYTFSLPNGKYLTFETEKWCETLQNQKGKYGLLIYSGYEKLNKDFKFIISDDQEKAKAEFEALTPKKSGNN